MIERLILSRFRGIRKGILDDIGQFNLLVGPNNSGKSTVLEAIYWISTCGRKCRLLSASSGKELPEYIPEEGIDAFVPIKSDLMGYSPCPHLWKRHGKPDSWHELHLEKDGTLSYRVPHLRDDEPLKAFRLVPPPPKEIKDLEKFTKDDRITICVFALDEPEGIDDLLKYYLPELYPRAFLEKEIPRRFVFTWFQDFVYMGEKLGALGAGGKPADPDCVLFFDFHTTAEHFMKEFYQNLRDVPDWRTKLTEAFGNVFPIGKFTASIEPYTGGMMRGCIEPEGRRTLSIDDFGDGARHAFKVLAALIVLADRCKDGKEGVFLWEDPELFMHQSTIGKLLSEVSRIVKDKPIQVFIATQSLEVLAYSAKMIEKKIFEENVRTYTLSLTDGELTARKLWGTALSDWLLSGFDPRLSDVSGDNLPFTWYLKKEKGEEDL